jgi:hypothetical protein
MATDLSGPGNLRSSTLDTRLINGCVVALLVLGVVWRTARYLLQFPIWGDEAHIALNVLDRNYLELLQPLRFVQAAPLLFLWAERTAYQLLGSSELAMRLLSFLGGLGGLLLFWRLARTVLPGMAGALAVGILAVSYYPVRHSCEVKPYGVDLFVSVVLLLLALNWLREPGRYLWPITLLLFLPLALGVSYPAVLIAGTVSLVLLPIIVRESSWKTKVLYLAYNGVMLASFIGYYWLIGVGQYDSEGGSDNRFYSEWFPPANPWSFFRWLVDVHTGNLLAYPMGGHSGGSTLTTLLCLLGIFQLSCGKQWRLLTLCLAPFGLTLLAAAMHRYPYGGSARYEQHLAPLICLLTGSGMAAVIMALGRWAISAKRAALVAFGLLAVAGAVGLARDVFKPYKTEGDLQVRQFLLNIVQQAGLDDQIVVMDPADWLAPSVEWYLRQQGQRVAWNGRIDWDKLHADKCHLWNLYFSPDASRPGQLSAELKKKEGDLMLVQHDERWMQMGWSWDDKTRRYCEYYHWQHTPLEVP